MQIQRREGAVELLVHVQPGASREAVGGTHGGALRVRVRAPPERGAANDAVRRCLARALGRRPGDVAIRAGYASRRKRVRIAGPPELLEARIRELAGAGEAV